MSHYQRHNRQADRHQALDQLRAQDAPTDRLWGPCDMCGQVHRQPAIRYRCVCGWARCTERVDKLGTVCPECGREMRIQPTTTMEADQDDAE